MHLSRVGIAHQKYSAIGNEMVGNAHPTAKKRLHKSLNLKKGNELVLIARFLQLLGMLLLVEGLYLGIVQHSMNLEILCVGLGIGAFYVGRWLQGKGS